MNKPFLLCQCGGVVVRASDLQPIGRTHRFESASRNDPGQVVHTQKIGASVTKQYTLDRPQMLCG